MSKRKVARKIIAPKNQEKGHSPRTEVFSLHRHGSKLLIVFCLIAATLGLFWPLGNHEFIEFDDDQYVYANPQVKAGLTLEGMVWAFTTTRAGYWHPLTWLSHMLDCEFYGVRAGRHHITNLLLHLANTLLLFLVLERMTGKLLASSFVAALFALHPLHVESVAWIAERKDVLSTFFWMLTLWTYVRYTERRTVNRYLVVLFSFSLGLLSKPMLVTLPCVMLLLDYWPLGRLQVGLPSGHWSIHDNSLELHNPRSSTHRIILEKLPFFALAAVSSSVTFLSTQVEGVVGTLESYPLEVRAANALVTYLIYIGKMIWPHPLAALYPHPGMWPAWQVAGAGLLLAGISVLVVRGVRRYPYLGVGWFWYLGTLVPVIGLVQVGTQGMADRYTYIPLIGLFIMIAWGIPDLLARWRYRATVLAISAGLLLSIFMMVTRNQIHRWHDSVPLFEHTLNVTTGNFRIHDNLGSALIHRGKYEEAIAHYNEALRIKPDDLGAHYGLGNALIHQRKYDEAIVHYTEALRIKPGDAVAHYGLGVALGRQEKYQEAIDHFTEALRINPQDASNHYNQGNILARQGKYNEAIAHFAEALRIKPDYAEAHFSRGLAYLLMKDQASALEEYRKLMTINPDLANTLSQEIFGAKDLVPNK
jgi:protein O-mannosyl-transferase